MTGVAGTFVGAVNSLEYGFKFRFDDAWGLNLGFKDGVLQQNRNNITVAARNYTVTLYIHHDPDLKMFTDPRSDGIGLKAGEMKFRANDRGVVNFEPKDDGALVQNENEIPIAEAGTNDIILDTNKAALTRAALFVLKPNL